MDRGRQPFFQRLRGSARRFAIFRYSLISEKILVTT